MDNLTRIILAGEAGDKAMVKHHNRAGPYVASTIILLFCVGASFGILEALSAVFSWLI